MSSDVAGPPRRRIALAEPSITGNEWAYVRDCLDTGWVSSVGAYVDRFERDFAAHLGARQAVATSSGTAALHIALLVAGVQKDDEVVVPTLTFIAPANAVRYAGAWPVFLDVEARYWQLDPEMVEVFVTRHCDWRNGQLRNRKTGRRVSAILPVHILGHPVDMDPLVTVARKYGLAVIEDATESLGAAYKGRKVGTLGDVACFSFNGNKLLTTGGGGMLVTDRPDWADRAKYLTTQAKDDALEFVHQEIGFNYRLTNIQAAIGCAQLEKIEGALERKRQIAARYASALGSIPGVRLMSQAGYARSSFWLYTILLDSPFPLSSRALMRGLGAAGIQARPLWQPMHRSPAHRDAESVGGAVADQLHDRALSLPSSVGLTAEDQQDVLAGVLSAGATA